ncbi:MAG: glycosyltransferase family 4 protein [Chthoniobacterales bacterium]
MKILISSHAFSPSIGGIETVSALLAAEFVRLGHVVTVVTQTQSAVEEQNDYSVLREPSFSELKAALGRCDVFWQNNLSLRTLWPALITGKPVIVTHQGSYCRKPSGIDLVQRLKHGLVRRTKSVAISTAVASCFATDSTIIHNPYDARLFGTSPAAEKKTGDLIFLGRLVTEKGIDLLLEALAQLKAQDLSPSLTIVGGGPELPRIESLSMALGLSEQVTFTGPKRGAELVELLRRHTIQVIPSRYEEPFGVVALEGIASGCVIVGSEGGGLPEAIGPCGLTFPNGDATALSQTLRSLLAAPEEQVRLRTPATDHLAKFHPTKIAQDYLNLFAAELT